MKMFRRVNKLLSKCFYKLEKIDTDEFIVFRRLFLNPVFELSTFKNNSVICV